MTWDQVRTLRGPLRSCKAVVVLDGVLIGNGIWELLTRILLSSLIPWPRALWHIVFSPEVLNNNCHLRAAIVLIADGGKVKNKMKTDKLNQHVDHGKSSRFFSNKFSITVAWMKMLDFSYSRLNVITRMLHERCDIENHRDSSVLLKDCSE